MNATHAPRKDVLWPAAYGLARPTPIGRRLRALFQEWHWTEYLYWLMALGLLALAAKP